MRLWAPALQAFVGSIALFASANAEDITVKPSFLVSAIFVITGWEAAFSERALEAPFIDRKKDTIWRVDANDKCVLLQEAMHEDTFFSINGDDDVGSRAHIIRYDFRRFPKVSEANSTRFSGLVVLPLPPGAFCLAERINGEVKPLRGASCFADFEMPRGGEAARRLGALKYVHEAFCASELSDEPKVTQP
jgi:hypothetical protein